MQLLVSELHYFLVLTYQTNKEKVLTDPRPGRLQLRVFFQFSFFYYILFFFSCFFF